MRIVPSTMEDDGYLPASWRVLTALLRRPALTQAELRAQTGLSHPVIVQQVTALRELGLVQSGTPLYGRPGRPRIPLTINWQFRRVLTVDVHATGLTAVAVDLAGQPLSPVRTASLPAWSPEGLRTALERLIARMVKEPGAPWAGIGLVLPGTPSRDGQTLLTCAGMPNCTPDPLATALAGRFNLPVVLESDGTALATGAWSQQPSAPSSLMALSLRHQPRIGMGLLVDGQRVPGLAADCAGLGTIRVSANGAAKAVGQEACLQSLLTAAQDDTSLRPHAIHALGIVAAHLVTALAPKHLALQGDALWTDEETEHFHATLREHGSSAVMSALTLDAHGATPDACLTGVASILINRLLDFRQGVIAQWVATAETAAV